jgi:hypothetical protein
MAHYMLNRHPERFSCLAVRQSNFTANVLDANATSHSLYHPILILGTEKDFAICKRESAEAIAWYESHGYRNLAWVNIRRLGHERTPDVAADFFARVCGATPNRPPAVLMNRQAIAGNARGLEFLGGNMSQLQRSPQEPPPATVAMQTSDRQPATPVRREAAPPTRPRQRERTTTANRTATPARGQPENAPAPRRTPVRIRVSSSIGFEPLLLVYSAECPADWYHTADFHWLLNGDSIGSGVNGQKTITEPDDYVLELLVVTRDGREHRASHPIRVLRNVEAAAVTP